nr:immunoglobulin light chain junction region [Macaca mulatta]
SMQALEFPWTF